MVTICWQHGLETGDELGLEEVGQSLQRSGWSDALEWIHSPSRFEPSLKLDPAKNPRPFSWNVSESRSLSLLKGTDLCSYV